MMNNTFVMKKEDISRDWHVIDAKNRVLGSVAAEASKLILGKHKPTYTPNLNMGDKVIIINAEQVAVTGNKLQDKVYYRHTNYPGGLRSETLEQLLKRRPEEVVRKAVFGMLPKNKLRKRRITNLHVYKGAEHPHSANVTVEK